MVPVDVGHWSVIALGNVIEEALPPSNDLEGEKSRPAHYQNLKNEA